MMRRSPLASFQFEKSGVNHLTTLSTPTGTARENANSGLGYDQSKIDNVTPPNNLTLGLG